MPSPVVLRGLSAKVRTSVSVHVTALGVKSVTFYLDGRKLKTVTKAKNQRYSIKVSARGLGYGRHRLQVRVAMRNTTCATAAAAGAFVKVKPIDHPAAEVHRLAVTTIIVPGVGTRAARSLALGIGIGALAFGPGAGVAGADAPLGEVAGGARGGRPLQRAHALAVGLSADGRHRAQDPVAGSTRRGAAALPDRGRPGRGLPGAEEGAGGADRRDVDEGGAAPSAPTTSAAGSRRARSGTLHIVRGRLVVRRSKLRATLYNGAGHAIWSARVGVGRPSLPTPAGHFYLREKLRAIGAPMYGPYALGTSAYAPTLTDWPGGGVVGIHGTDEPGLIPGRPSHGCIRLRNPDITRLWHLISVGTPIDVI